MTDEKLVVIGGGIIGVSTAYYLKLLSPRAHVVLLEKHSEVGYGCSFQNGGILDPWTSDPWTYPQTCWKVIKNWWKPAQHMQLTWNAVLSPSFWLWGSRFVVSSLSGESIQVSMEKLAVRTFDLHQEFMARHGEGLPNYSHDAPLLEVMKDEEQVKEYASRASSFNARFKTNYTYLDAAACLEEEPELKTCDFPVKACILHAGVKGSNADSFQFTKAISTMAENLGVEVVRGASVTAFETNKDKVTAVVLSDGSKVAGDKFVVCAGIDSKALGKQLGWTPPLWAVKGYSYNFETTRKFRHTVHLHSDQTMIVNPLQSGVRHSFFAEFTHPEDYEINQKNIDMMTERLAKFLKTPELERSRYWTGMRPASSDDLPIVGKFPKYSNTFINAGHGSRGMLLSLGSSELIATIMLGLTTSTKLHVGDYSPNRFWF
jgi:D-amino-acid dehydrogenase